MANSTKFNVYTGKPCMITPLSTDATLAGSSASDTVAPSQKAVKDYIGNKTRFLVTNGTGATDVTGDGTVYTVLWPTEVYDQGSNFASNTFTAPTTGVYLFNVSVSLEGLLAAHNHVELRLVTSNRTYENHQHMGVAIPDMTLTLNVLADMDATDTAYVAIMVDGSTKVVDVFAGANNNFFSGFLMN